MDNPRTNNPEHTAHWPSTSHVQYRAPKDSYTLQTRELFYITPSNKFYSLMMVYLKTCS
jgi:hypothetical protein